jgi:hypothetical protein
MKRRHVTSLRSKTERLWRDECEISAIRAPEARGVVNKALPRRRGAGGQNVARELHRVGRLKANHLMRT